MNSTSCKVKLCFQSSRNKFATNPVETPNKFLLCKTTGLLLSFRKRALLSYLYGNIDFKLITEYHFGAFWGKVETGFHYLFIIQNYFEFLIVERLKLCHKIKYSKYFTFFHIAF